MLEKWTARKGMGKSVAELIGLTPDQLRIALQMLAADVHGRDAGQLGGGAVEFERKDLLDRVYDINPDARQRAVFDYLETRAGILVSPRSKWFRFAHLTFQEHLAACELTHPPAVRRVPPVDPANVFPTGLVNRVLAAPDRWRNVARLAADELSLARTDDLWRLVGDMLRPLRGAPKSGLPQPGPNLNLRRAALSGAGHGARTRPGLQGLGRVPFPGRRAARHARCGGAFDGRSGDDCPGARRRRNALARLGDPRFNPAWWHLPSDAWAGFVRIEADPHFVIGTPEADFERVMQACGVSKENWEYHKQEINDAPAPTHEFYMARYPVTAAQWRAYVEERSSRDPSFKVTDEGSLRGQDNHPVARMTWREAMAYCDRLGSS